MSLIYIGEIGFLLKRPHLLQPDRYKTKNGRPIPTDVRLKRKFDPIQLSVCDAGKKQYRCANIHHQVISDLL